MAIRCEECDREFAPLEGGTCAACSRVLCSDHFRQSGGATGAGATARPVCDACVTRGARTTAV